jgi:hypothetical protein
MSNEPVKFDPNTVTGNPGRDMLLKGAILKLESNGDDPSLLPSVQLELPPDFDLDAGELAAMLDHMHIAPVENTPEQVRGDPVEADLPAEGKSGEAAPVEPPTMTQDEAHDAVVMWEKKLAHARGARLGAEQKARDMRTKLGAAVQEFVTGFSQLTHEQAVRAIIATEAERKAAGIPLGRPRNVLGPSVVDQAAGGHGHSANRSFAPKFRRGASTIKGSLNFDPRKGPVAKLPSQR